MHKYTAHALHMCGRRTLAAPETVLNCTSLHYNTHTHAHACVQLLVRWCVANDIIKHNYITKTAQ